MQAHSSDGDADGKGRSQGSARVASDRAYEPITAALLYAQRGWLVFPCRGKTPLTPHSFRDATTDPEAIEVWWRKFPTATIGIATGHLSGVVVLDIDNKSKGPIGWDSLEELDLSVVDTRQAFFEGRDANNPTEAVTFTRGFRPPTRLPGSPVVPIAAHPTKNAANDNLIPYGGGSTLNEVDGNFTLATVALQ